MLLALSALGADPKKIKELMDEYIQILYPEHDHSEDSFMKKAQEKLDRHLGKPFVLDKSRGDGFNLRPEIEER